MDAFDGAKFNTSARLSRTNGCGFQEISWLSAIVPTGHGRGDRARSRDISEQGRTSSGCPSRRHFSARQLYFIDVRCMRWRLSPLLPIAVVPQSISAQHTLKKADLLGNDIDRLLSLQWLGDRSSGFNRCQLPDCSVQISSRVRQ